MGSQKRLYEGCCCHSCQRAARQSGYHNWDICLGLRHPRQYPRECVNPDAPTGFDAPWGDVLSHEQNNSKPEKCYNNFVQRCARTYIREIQRENCSAIQEKIVRIGGGEVPWYAWFAEPVVDTKLHHVQTSHLSKGTCTLFFDFVKAKCLLNEIVSRCCLGSRPE